MAHSIRRLVEAGLVRLRLRGRNAVGRAVRLTVGAVTAFVVAQLLFPGSVPILAALTALLVVEVTLKDIVTNGLQRVAAVTTGVLVAVAFSSMVGLTWWGMAAMVAVAIMIGQVLRLGPNMLEVPISAMLVLAVGGAEAAAIDRISETLLGAGVGIAVNLAFPPAVRSDSAAQAVQRFAGELARLVRTAATQMRDPITAAQATRWLDEARTLSRNVPEIDKAVREAETSRRLNPRALVVADTSKNLRADMDALEHTSVTVRSMFRSILDGVRDVSTVDPTRGEDLRLVFSALLEDVAASVEAFGEVVIDEGTRHVGASEKALTSALTRLSEAKDRADDLNLMDPGTGEDGWELSDPVLQAVQRVLRDLDVIGQSRRAKATPKVNPRVDPLEIIRSAHEILQAAPKAAARVEPSARRSADRKEIPADQTGPQRLPLGRTPGHRSSRSRRDESPLETGRMRAVSRPGGRATSRPARRS